MRPRLIGIEHLTIRPIDRENLLLDDDGDAPLGSLARLPTVEALPAQVDEIADGDRRPEQGGGQLRAIYRVTVRTADLERLGYQPRNGDRVVSISDRKRRNAKSVNLYLRLSVAAGNMIGGQRSLRFFDLMGEHPSRWGTDTPG